MENINIFGSGRHADDCISYYVTKALLKDYDEYERFIKGCEHAVRKDDRYTAYVGKLKSHGLDRCAILGNIKNDSKVSLEMHHGPIFNLFDICDIVTRALLVRGEKELTTFDVGDAVLTQHEKDNIMIVMLSKTPHKGAHVNLFIDIKSTFGRIDRFIDEYEDGMIEEHWDFLSRYLDMCASAPSTMDNGLFDTANRLKSFK